MNHLGLEPHTLELEIVVKQTTNYLTLDIQSDNTINEEVQKNVDARTHTVKINHIDNFPCTVSVKISGKTSADTIIDEQGNIVADSIVMFNKVWVDGILLENWALHDYVMFKPCYDQSQLDYFTENNLTVYQEIVGEVECYNNGVWVITLDKDFFTTYNQTLLSSFNNYSEWVKETHLGLINSEQLSEMREILESLNV